ncbi:MBL fold metallo-hydrolase [Anthocerotibacter panamensis]|uniref:MBL fold metallo-hydrolase n=1 Tax=Anthocerotibacter panamensis TaxID=2857077 RepID=UPI001C40438F|nr:MBL fold metallo-hydrolase [Anthocerotibacter panamensis]
MAHLTERRTQNVPGDFYVDTSCIDCDTCRWMAPEIYYRAKDQSAVHHQPSNATERLRALQALLACPTASIGTVEKPRDITQAQATFPLLVAGEVYHCGYHSAQSFGATSYFIQRSTGNVLVDSPRFTPPLVKRLEAMGGIRYLYLTHRDDVADHQRFRDHFGCERILHEQDLTAATRDIEMPLSGTEAITLAADLVVIPTPGHTPGHTVLLYAEEFLFTGDHLFWSEQHNQLRAFRDHCWYSWPQLVQSTHQFQDYTFTWVLPGHGRRYHAERATMAQKLAQCLDWMATTV